MLGVIDIANGITFRTPPAETVFPDVDPTVHFDADVSFGPHGAGVTHATLHYGSDPAGFSAPGTHATSGGSSGPIGSALIKQIP